MRPGRRLGRIFAKKPIIMTTTQQVRERSVFRIMNQTEREALFREREKALETRVAPSKGAIIVRADGRAFHTLTRNMKKPFDDLFVQAMDNATLSMIKAIPNVDFAYVQSDEISVVIRPNTKVKYPEGVPFAGRVEKLVSVLASAATAGFASIIPNPPAPALFDARALVTNSYTETIDYLKWRIADSVNNAFSAVATHEFGHKAMLHVPAAKRQEMLAEQGVIISGDMLFGRIALRTVEERETTWADKQGQEHKLICERNVWNICMAAPEIVGLVEQKLKETEEGCE